MRTPAELFQAIRRHAQGPELQPPLRLSAEETKILADIVPRQAEDHLFEWFAARGTD